MENEYKDVFFGQLQWDDDCEWYAGEASLADGVPVSVTLAPSSKQEIEGFALAAAVSFTEVVRRLNEIRATMRDEYLKLYNESWSQVVNGYGQPVGLGAITATQFDRLVGLESLGFVADGSVELSFSDDGQLFGGHTICVRLDRQLNIKGMGLEG